MIHGRAVRVFRHFNNHVRIRGEVIHSLLRRADVKCSPRSLLNNFRTAITIGKSVNPDFTSLEKIAPHGGACPRVPVKVTFSAAGESCFPAITPFWANGYAGEAHRVGEIHLETACDLRQCDPKTGEERKTRESLASSWVYEDKPKRRWPCACSHKFAISFIPLALGRLAVQSHVYLCGLVDGDFPVADTNRRQSLAGLFRLKPAERLDSMGFRLVC